MRTVGIAAAAALLSACGNSGPDKAQAETSAAALQPGEYELAWSDINRTPAAKSEAGAQTAAAPPYPNRACVAPGGKIEPAAFAEEGDDCHIVESYVRNGIVNVQLSCKRDGGKVSAFAEGRFTADALDANVETTTTLDKGNYTLTRKLTAKRVGECAPAAETGEGDKSAKS